jgi:repressor LexA
MMSIGERVKERRLEEGHTCKELAKLTGYASRTTISKIEHGNINPAFKRIEKLALALNTTEAYLLGLTDDPERRKE